MKTCSQARKCFRILFKGLFIDELIERSAARSEPLNTAQIRLGEQTHKIMSWKNRFMISVNLQIANNLMLF